MLLVINSDMVILDDDMVARQPYDALHELLGVLSVAVVGETRFCQDDDITALWNVLVVRDARPSAGQFPDDKPVVIVEGVLHAWPVDLIALEDKDGEQDSDERREQEDANGGKGIADSGEGPTGVLAGT